MILPVGCEKKCESYYDLNNLTSSEIRNLYVDVDMKSNEVSSLKVLQSEEYFHFPKQRRSAELGLCCYTCRQHYH